MYRTVLVRSIKTKMDVEKELPRVLQHFVFLLNKYYRLNFKEDAIPSPDDFQSILSEFDKLIPWNPPSPDLSHPTTPESSLSTLTDDSDEIEVIPDG
ncbi:hypothetical protein HA402_005426 [Bradysia odoriphaga]|nr:hypothetical protein HA402_005426 [Bradysia odoriphaga]